MAGCQGVGGPSYLHLQGEVNGPWRPRLVFSSPWIFKSRIGCGLKRWWWQLIKSINDQLIHWRIYSSIERCGKVYIDKLYSTVVACTTCLFIVTRNRVQFMDCHIFWWKGQHLNINHTTNNNIKVKGLYFSSLSTSAVTLKLHNNCDFISRTFLKLVTMYERIYTSDVRNVDFRF